MIILFVEDDKQLASVSIDFLTDEGIDVDYAPSIAVAKEIAKANEYDAIVLDLELPDGLGYELVPYFKQTKTNTPILFLTAQSDIEHKLRAFELGALDYITKPFELAELAARIKLLHAKSNVGRHDEFSLSFLSVNFTTRTLYIESKPVTLSPQQWALLTLLVNHHPNTVAKQKIIDHVWPNLDVNSNMYKSLITRLRKNLTNEHQQSLIHTIKGIGVSLHE